MTIMQRSLDSYFKTGESSSTSGKSVAALDNGRPLTASRSKRERSVPSPDDSPPPLDGVDENGAEDSETRVEDESAIVPTRPSKRPKIRNQSSGPTPLEKQVLALKAEYQDLLLVIQVGYKFRFFGEDAEIASQLLNIACFQDRLFKTAMIPVGRIYVHLKRLISKGYKVGVIRQIETPALKAISQNKSQPFERKLTEVYTNATWLPETDAMLDDQAEAQSNFLLTLSDEVKGSGDEKTQIGIMAINVQTGEVVYDHFSDDLFRSELTTRLAHLQPTELVVPPNLSRATRKALLSASKARATEEQEVRVEDLKESVGMQEAQHKLQQFYAAGSSDDKVDSLAIISRLSGLVQISLSYLIDYLREFKLEHLLDLPVGFRPFQHRNYMVLGTRALTNLEIFQTSSGGPKGLFYILNHTFTAFGKRLLRQWVSRPLLNAAILEARREAIDDLANNVNGVREKLGRVLINLPDLEKGLVKIAMKRISPSELISLLNAVRKIGETRLNIFISSCQLLEISQSLTKSNVVLGLLDLIHQPEAAAGNKASMWTNADMFPELEDAKACIGLCQHDLEEELKRLRKELGKPALAFASVAGIDYLIEIPSKEAKKMPPDWIRVSSTKAVTRFHTTTLLRMIAELARYKEVLSIEADKAYQNFLERIWNETYQDLRILVKKIAELDCLLSLARLNHQPGYCKPEFVKDQILEISDARHPIVLQTSSAPFVSNSVSLRQDKLRALVITGPNMGGKSSFVRTIALIVVLAQIGCWVPATEARLGLFDAIYARMGAEDNIFKGQSTFMVEMQEASAILESATARSLILFDEVGRGSSTLDGHAIAHAVLDYAVSNARAGITFFITHYPLIATTLAMKYPENVQNCHMGFLETGSLEQKNHEIVFLYKLVQGLADRSYGLNVARLAGLPESLIANAASRSLAMEHTLNQRHEIIKRRQIERALQMLASTRTEPALALADLPDALASLDM